MGTFPAAPLRTGRERFRSSGSPELILGFASRGGRFSGMNVFMTFIAYHKCFALDRYHLLDPFGFLPAACPSLLQVGQLAHVVDFTLLL